MTDKARSDTWTAQHAERRRIYLAQWRKAHRAQVRNANRAWYQKHRKQANASTIASRKRNWAHYLEYTRLWRKRNRDKVNRSVAKSYKKRIVRDVAFRIAKRLRSRMCKYITRELRPASTVRDLGCTLPELLVHLKAKFKPGMSFENYGPKGWHIDHITPLSAFNLADVAQAKRAFHYTNLQPLWWHENLRKSDKHILESAQQVENQ